MSGAFRHRPVSLRSQAGMRRASLALSARAVRMRDAPCRTADWVRRIPTKTTLHGRLTAVACRWCNALPRLRRPAAPHSAAAPHGCHAWRADADRVFRSARMAHRLRSAPLPRTSERPRGSTRNKHRTAGRDVPSRALGRAGGARRADSSSLYLAHDGLAVSASQRVPMPVQ